MNANRLIADFQVGCRSEMHDKLEAAVSAAQVEARASGTQGVLVTRHDFARFSVSLSHDVPFGLTREHDHVSRR